MPQIFKNLSLNCLICIIQVLKPFSKLLNPFMHSKMYFKQQKNLEEGYFIYTLNYDLKY